MSSINADNGVTSGITGIRTTADNTGNLALQTNGNTVLTLNTSNVATFAGNVTVSGSVTQSGNAAFSANVSVAGSLNSINTFGFKNRIINGAMVIDQRNAGASVTQNTAGIYTVDRWGAYGTVNAKFTIQQSSTAPAGFINSALITSSSAYSVGSSDQFVYYQNIEGLNVSDLGWGTADAKTITLSFQVRSSLTGTFGGSIRNSAYDRSYPFSYTISSANTWTQISITIAGDTTGTWLKTNGIGLIVAFCMGAGSSLLTTGNSWTSGNYVGATGAQSVVGTNGATWYITGVQLEVGSQATSFDYRDYGRELILCQRYYEISKFVSLGSNYSNSYPQMTYRVTKRTSPTITFSDNGGAFTPAYDQNGFYQNSQNTNNVAYAVNVLSSAEL